MTGRKSGVERTRLPVESQHFVPLRFARESFRVFVRLRDQLVDPVDEILRVEGERVTTVGPGINYHVVTVD